MLPAKGIDPDNFFLILFSVVLANGIAIKQFIINIVRIVPFFALLLLPYRLLHHPHHYLLQVILSHQVSSDSVAVVVVIVLFEKQQFLFGREGRLNKLNHIGK